MPEERKLVTILFADTTDSTALGETLDPEDVRALMGRYYDHAQRIIAEHGGTLEKFIGDAVMAVFGLVQAHSNDAERALAASLALLRAIAKDAVLAGRIVLRAGVHTGEVIATTDVTRGDFLVTGDAVNVAARLEQAATPGEILVSERAADAARASFLFGAARSITVKGKSRPLRVVPLTGQRPTRQLGHPPLVGRKSDLAQLALLRDRALAERRPQLVSVIAPAGTGKTRLLEEFLARLDPRAGWRVATARCLPYGQTLTFWPLRGLLEELLGGTFTPEAISDAFAAAGHAQDDADHFAGLVLATLGIEPEGGAERETIFGAWRLLVEALARQAPRIIVFEDLHWASESLLDLVEHLMQPRTEAALLIVATSRPELLDRRTAWGGGRRSFTALALEPLSAAEMRTLVGKLTKAVTKKLPEAARERVVERAGGNPFFIIELARALTERSLAGGAATADTLPDTVQEALQEQLDQLSRPERAALQAAAVAGRTFRLATLRAVLDAPAPAAVQAEPGALEAALNGLLARDLIVPAEESGAYTFRHILVRDVAYGTLARAERIRLHQAVAAWLEEFGGDRVDEFIELIAYHEREAAHLARQSAVPLAAPADTARAVQFLSRAAGLANRKGAYVEAKAYLESAIALAPDAVQGPLYEQLGDTLHFISPGRPDAYRLALARWRAAGAEDPLIGARLLRKLLMFYGRTYSPGRPSNEELLAMLHEALLLAEAAGSEDERWHVGLAQATKVFGWRDLSGETVRESLRESLAAAAYFEAHQDWAAFSEALDVYMVTSATVGALEEALDAGKRRLAIPRLPPLEYSDALHMLAGTYLMLGDYEGCIQMLREAIARLRPGEAVAHLTTATAYPIWAAVVSGHWLECAPFIALLAEGWKQLGYAPDSTVHESYSMVLHLAMAREGQALADDGLPIYFERIVNVEPIAARSSVYSSLARAMCQDDPRLLNLDPANYHPYSPFELVLMFLNDRGTRAPEPVLDLARRKAHAMNSDFGRRFLTIAEALAADDNTQLSVAIDEAEAHGLIPHAARMRIVLAQRTGDRAPLEIARPVLERLGDRQFLRRLEEVAASLQ